MMIWIYYNQTNPISQDRPIITYFLQEGLISLSISTCKKQLYKHQQVQAKMDKSLDTTSYSIRQSTENLQVKYQKLNKEYYALKAEHQNMKTMYENDKNLYKNKRAQLDIAEKTIEELRKKIKEVEKREEENKKKYQKEKLEAASNNQKDKDTERLKADFQKQKKELNTKLAQLRDKLAKKQKTELELTQKIRHLEAENEQLQLKETELKQQLTDHTSREDTFDLTLPENSSIRPTRQRVLLKSSEAELINENTTLKFQLENLKKKMKEQEQISAKKQNGLKKSLQNYQTFKPQRGMSSIIQLSASRSKLKKPQTKDIDFKTFNIDEQNHSCDIPSFKRANKDFFSKLQEYYNTLSESQTTLFLNAIADYAEYKFQQRGEISDVNEFQM